jgi:toxin HigB-1
VIESFRKGLQRLYENDDRRKLPADMVDRIRGILAALDAATAIEALNQPTLRLHALKAI